MRRGVPAEYLSQPDRYFLEWLPQRLDASDQKQLGQKHAIAQFALSGDDGGQWYIELGNGAVVPHRGTHAKPSFTLAMSVDTWRSLNKREMSGVRAYLRGDVKITGSVRALLRVGKLFGPKG